jgi:hypothetical protein
MYPIRYCNDMRLSIHIFLKKLNVKLNNYNNQYTLNIRIGHMYLLTLHQLARRSSHSGTVLGNWLGRGIVRQSVRCVRCEYGQPVWRLICILLL